MQYSAETKASIFAEKNYETFYNKTYDQTTFEQRYQYSKYQQYFQQYVPQISETQSF